MDQKHALTSPANPTSTPQHSQYGQARSERGNLYETLAVIFFALWLIVVVTAYAKFGGLVHIFLACAFVMLVIRASQIRRTHKQGPVYLNIRRE